VVKVRQQSPFGDPQMDETVTLSVIRSGKPLVIKAVVEVRPEKT